MQPYLPLAVFFGHCPTGIKWMAFLAPDFDERAEMNTFTVDLKSHARI
jgi:hypothetical protein